MSKDFISLKYNDYIIKALSDRMANSPAAKYLFHIAGPAQRPGNCQTISKTGFRSAATKDIQRGTAKRTSTFAEMRSCYHSVIGRLAA